MDSTKILIVEDEPKVAAFIKKGLEENNYEVDVAYDGITGKKKALSQNHNLIILDINLPQLNGFQLCKLIRENNPNIPILMLTALGSLDDKIKGFDVGADDYLLKPFEFIELLARLKALQKRTQNKVVPESKIIISDLIIDRNAKSVLRAGKKIELTAKEFSLLEYMAINKGRVIPRFELTENVWDINFDTGTNVVDVYINFVRKKIDSNSQKKLIYTKIGMGYILTDEE